MENLFRKRFFRVPDNTLYPFGVQGKKSPDIPLTPKSGLLPNKVYDEIKDSFQYTRYKDSLLKDSFPKKLKLGIVFVSLVLHFGFFIIKSLVSFLFSCFFFRKKKRKPRAKNRLFFFFNAI